MGRLLYVIYSYINAFIVAQKCLPCEAAGFARLCENPSRQASSYALMSEPPVVQINQRHESSYLAR